eukprot:CAMPEP_0170138440 /NCGR_PEP_ID=MMETSP0033_2-20121228/4922_1 /TAXON_ID=195969 /ORGANISM="Dolichomastix tenuilepis, Strain CCMP3274" /LENGTH=212 /DNA_ID=CAMNT_0010374447 /DNA_START=110 /DNA_END=748 /DNA_ORIENTATION=-
MEPAAVIWMHGLGDSGSGWSDIGDQLEGVLPHVKWEFPDAPSQPVSCNGGMVMPSWFDLGEIPVSPDSALPSESDMAASIARVEKLIKAKVASGIPRSRIAVGGFSQGGALALATGMASPEPLGAIVCFSGWVATPRLEPAAEATRDARILWCHGTLDPVVLPACQAEGMKRLEAAKFSRASFRQYPMPHSACAEELQDLAEFLALALPGRE